MNKIKIALSRKQWMVTIIVVLGAIVAFTWNSLNFASKNRIISEVGIEIKVNSNGFNFYEKSDITELLQKTIGNPIGKPTSEIKLTQFELKLNTLPQIENAQVYVDFSGTLKVKIKERIPIALVFTNNGKSFYLDSNGIVIPDLKVFKAPIFIINGNINPPSNSKKSNKKIWKELTNISNEIYHNELLALQFEQCYVDKFNRYLLIPKVGKHTIVLNNTSNIGRKFENLGVFYKKGLPKLGWNKYREIDISYENQIVARQ